MSSGNECCVDVNKLSSLLSETSVDEKKDVTNEVKTELSFACRGLKLDKAEDGRYIIYIFIYFQIIIFCFVLKASINVRYIVMMWYPTKSCNHLFIFTSLKEII